MKPIRVAQVMGQMGGGGVEAVIMNYYRAIDRSLVQFDFVVNEGSTRVPEEEIAELGGHVYTVPDYAELRKYQRGLCRLFQEQRYPVVHSNVNALSFFPLREARKAKVPVRIAHSHSTAGHGEPTKNLMKDALRLLANVYPTDRFACSEYAGRWLFGKSAEFSVVYNALEVQKYRFDASVREQVRRDELGVSDETFVVGHVGRFVYQKNHRFLLDVFAEIAKLAPESLLLLVGEGEMKETIQREASRRGLGGNVVFTGQRDDAHRLYQAMDAFVLPSHYEGLPVVGIEAQSASLPCFFSDAISKEVQVTPGCTFLPLGESAAFWAREILDLAQNARRAPVSLEAFRDYDIEGASRRLCALYLELLERHGVDTGA